MRNSGSMSESESSRTPCATRHTRLSQLSTKAVPHKSLTARRTLPLRVVAYGIYQSDLALSQQTRNTTRTARRHHASPSARVVEQHTCCWHVARTRVARVGNPASSKRGDRRELRPGRAATGDGRQERERSLRARVPGAGCKSHPRRRPQAARSTQGDAPVRSTRENRSTRGSRRQRPQSLRALSAESTWAAVPPAAAGPPSTRAWRRVALECGGRRLTSATWRAPWPCWVWPCSTSPRPSGPPPGLARSHRRWRHCGSALGRRAAGLAAARRPS